MTQDGEKLLALWEKLWYVDIKTPAAFDTVEPFSLDDVLLVMGFDANDYSDGFDTATEWYLMYSGTPDGTYSSIASAHFNSAGEIYFGDLSLADLQSGCYTLGKEVPEPTTWGMLLFGILGGGGGMWISRRKK